MPSSSSSRSSPSRSSYGNFGRTSSSFGRGSNSSSNSSSYSRSKPSYTPTPAPPPSPVYSPSTPSTITVEQNRPTFGQTLKEGFGFGMGSAIAHRIFGGSTTHTVNHVQTPETPLTCNEKKCSQEKNLYFDCTKNNDGYSCESKFESFKKCLGINIRCENELNAYNSCIKYNDKDYCDSQLKSYESCATKSMSMDR